MMESTFRSSRESPKSSVNAWSLADGPSSVKASLVVAKYARNVDGGGRGIGLIDSLGLSTEATWELERVEWLEWLGFESPESEGLRL